MSFPIPEKALRQNIIALGKTGAGKSSALRDIVEPMLDEKLPVCIIDPKGDWWGLKLSADGKKPGYPLVIFGGKHADVPINERSGTHIAELFATGNRPCVIDLRGWMPGARTQFFIDFAATLFEKNEGRRWLVIDECHNFCPKGKVLDPKSGLSLHWANRLASEGRGLGITVFGASQRPQKVHNDFLTSCETLIAMRVLHASDRGAYKDWIDGCGDPAKGKEMLATIANLKRGTGYVWSPEIGFGPELVRFPLFKTYDSFAPQDEGKAAKLTGWAEVDLEEVKKKLADVVQEAEANDPKLLKQRIAELERQLAKPQDPAVDVDALKRAEQDGYERGIAVGVTAHQVLLSKLTLEFEAAESQFTAKFLTVLKEARPENPVRRVETHRPAEASQERRTGSALTVTRARQIDERASPNDSQLSAAARKILNVLSQYSHGCTAAKLALLTGYRYSGGFRNALSELRSGGLLAGENGGVMTITDAGRELGPFERLPMGKELQDYWLNHRSLGKCSRDILAQLLRHPNGLTAEKLASLTEYEYSGGFRNALSELRTAGVMVGKNTEVMRVTEELLQ